MKNVFLACFSAFVLACGSTSTQSSATPATERVVNVHGAFHHPSGMDFPEHVGEFTRTEVVQFPGSADNFGVAYQFGQFGMAQVTVYVYPTLGADLTSHFQQVVNDVVGVHKVAPIQQSAVEVSQNGETITGDAAVWDLTEQYGNLQNRIPLRSRALLFKRGNWFVKYRVTNPLSADQVVVSNVQQLLTTLRMPCA